jgi:hypothetical protein
MLLKNISLRVTKPAMDILRTLTIEFLIRGREIFFRNAVPVKLVA